MEYDDERGSKLQRHRDSQQLYQQLHGAALAQSLVQLGRHDTHHHEVDECQELVELEQTWRQSGGWQKYKLLFLFYFIE